MKMSRKGSSKRNIIAAIGTLIVIIAAILILSFTSPTTQTGGGGEEQQAKEEVIHVVVDDAGFVGGVGSTLIRLTVRNDGTVSVRIKEVVVKGDDIEGSQIQTKTLDPGQSAQLDVGLKKGSAKSGSNPVTFIIKTDKGDFEQEFTITVT